MKNGMSEIRSKVAMFMENNPTLTKLEGNAWYDMEDALVELVQECTEVVAKKCMEG